MLIKIQHAGYMVPNLDEAVEWYVNILGGVYWKGGETATSKIAFVRLGDGEVELIEPVDKSELGGATGPVHHHMGYVVDDLDAAVEELKKQGFRFRNDGPVVNLAGYRVAHFDPETTGGIRLHLTEESSLGWD
jgi:catechol 2,3-dioxygenase-like lactoylglutathione lyase family enzyme